MELTGDRTPVFPSRVVGQKHKTAPTPSPSQEQASKTVALDGDSPFVPAMSLLSDIADLSERQVNRIESVFLSSFAKYDKVIAVLLSKVDALGESNTILIDKVASLENANAQLASQVSVLDAKVLALESNGMVPCSQPTVSGRVENDTTRRGDLLSQIKRNCELLVLHDSQWREINVGKFGRSVGLFSYTARCSTLEYVPELIPTLVGDIDVARLKGVLISTGINDVESIGTRFSDDNQKTREFQRRVKDAIAAVAQAWPDVPIFIEKASPMMQPLVASDGDTVPRILDPRFEFSCGDAVTYDGAKLLISPDYMIEGNAVGVAVIARDGKHIGPDGCAIKVDCLSKGVCSVIARKPSGVSYQLRPVFDELRSMRIAKQTVSAQSLLSSAFAAMKALMDQNLFSNPFPPLNEQPWSRAMGFNNHPNPGSWGGGYRVPRVSNAPR
jgi:hypothetical protein